MIRKYTILALLGIGLASSAFANSVSTVVGPNTMGQILAINNLATVNQIVIAANTTNVSGLFIDSPTNKLSYITPAYSNTLSVATNWITLTTNYYGVATATTNIALYDQTNNLVPATTNNYNQVIGVATLASTSSRYDQVNYYFRQGIWFTNTSLGIATVTVTYH